MSNQRSLGELFHEFMATSGEYLKQNMADATERILVDPIRRAAKKVVILGLAIGMGIMAAVMLALAFFHFMSQFTDSKSIAYAISFAVCILIGALCAWAVSKDDSKSQQGHRRDAQEADTTVESDEKQVD